VDALVTPRTAAPPAAAPAGTPAAPRDCVHCGLPIPAARRARRDRFCCAGCERVHALIHEAGLQRYYDLRNCPTAPPPELRENALAWLDRLLEESPPAAVRSLTLDVQGIHCAACVWLLRELFRRTDGGVDLRINPAIGRAQLLWHDGTDAVPLFVREAERYGYRFGPPDKSEARRSHGLLIRLAVCTAAAMNAMIFSLCFYFGLAPADGALFELFGRLNLLLGTVAAVVGGDVFVRGAVRALRRGIVHLDLPIATGIVLAWSASAGAQLANGPHAGYFDSLAIFVTLMLLGRWLQERHLERNASALLATDSVQGLSTRVRRDGRIHPIPAADVAPGDELWIVPGDLVPVRAVLQERGALASLDWIDGESRPRPFEPGDTLPAGSFNATSEVIRATAEQSFPDSRLHELLRPGRGDDDHDVGEAWGRVARVYVFAVFALAIAGFLAWWPRGTGKALSVTISVLVVTCPCAIGLALPLAHDLVLHRLRRLGVFVRRAGFLDRAVAVRHVIFDKTGTLTRGRVALAPEAAAVIDRLDDADLAALHELAVRSNHPVSRAVAAAIAERRGTPPAAPRADTREVPGQGVEGRLGGALHRLGRRSFALGDAPGPSGDAVWWSADGQLRARLPYGEELRPDAAEEVARLRHAGYAIHLLSGDTADRVSGAAAAVGIDAAHARAACSPSDKAAFVRALDRGDTLVVGDGLNDAGAFDAATCAATPAVDHAALPARADFYYLGDGIAAVRAALEGARRLRRVVRDDLLLAALYNTIALALCFAGRVTPPVAAVLMPLGSLAILGVTVARLSPRSAAWK